MERLELLAFTLSRARGQFMRIIALYPHPYCVLTRFGVIIAGEDVNSGIALQAASGGREILKDSRTKSLRDLEHAHWQIHMVFQSMFDLSHLLTVHG